MPALTRTIAEQRLKAARDAFWFSLGAYALLTQEPSRSALSEFSVRISDAGTTEVARGDFQPSSGTSYTIGFNAGLDDDSARKIVEYAFRQMLIEGFETARTFAKENGQKVDEEPWYEFARHYRNAVAHNGHWNIKSDRGLPVVWRNKTIDSNLDGKSIDGFLSWYEGMQLGAQMTLFVSSSGR